jgi:hypothetical protein
MTNFPSTQARNMAGNDTFWYVPDSNVTLIPDPVDDVIEDDVVLADGELWKQGYATTDSLVVDDEPDFDAQGDNFSNRIIFRVPKDQPGTLMMLVNLKKRRHVVATRSRNQNIKVHGKAGAGLRFNYRPINEGGFNGYECEFYGTYDEPSWFYSGVITVDGGSFQSPNNPGTVYTVGGSWIFGATAPVSGQGKNGDGYFDYTSQLVYEKVANVWVLRGYLGPDQVKESIAINYTHLAITGNLM